jgi:hypothetical protein
MDKFLGPSDFAGPAGLVRQKVERDPANNHTSAFDSVAWLLSNLSLDRNIPLAENKSEPTREESWTGSESCLVLEWSSPCPLCWVRCQGELANAPDMMGKGETIP